MFECAPVPGRTRFPRRLRTCDPTMPDRPAYTLRLLDDVAGAWSEVLRHVPPDATGAAPSSATGCAIGVLCWESATPTETAELPSWRDRHDGPIVAILTSPPAARGARLLAARLEGAILLDEMEQTLRPTLAAVAVGQCVLPSALREILDRPALSPRERQLLAMVVLGFSNADIATKLFLSESNVKNHLSSAFQKLGVSSRNEATALILDKESGLGAGILRISSEETLLEGGEIN
jgi:DNA-binding CsgD family transcriptional regulator